MRISACVIVKNEEANIVAWLENVKYYADEIIVVDTGSTDKTVELAKQRGAKVYSFAWINDFAAAKNFALEKAHGDWIAFLDADETFSPRCVNEVRRTVETAARRPHMGGIICKLLNIDADKDNRLIDVVKQLRLFRNVKSLRYEGAVHEHLRQEGQDKHLLEYAAHLEIYHTGYSSGLIQEKLRRNLRLMEEARAKGRPVDWESKYRMDCCIGLKDWEGAIKAGYEALAENKKAIGQDEDIYVNLAEALRLAKHSRTEVLEIITRGLEEYPRGVALHYLAGETAWREEEYVGAEYCYQKCREFLEDKQQGDDAHELANNVGKGEQLKGKVYLRLGQLAEMRLAKGEAAELYLTGLMEYIYDKKLLLALCRLLWAGETTDLIALLQTVYQGRKETEWLSEALKSLPPGQVQLFFAQRVAKSAGREMKDAWQYLEAGRDEAALISAIENYENICRLGTAAGTAIGAGLSVLGGSKDLLPETYLEIWQGKEVMSEEALQVQRLRQGLFGNFCPTKQ